MKQLKNLKFKQEILINVYRSLTLSHYTYSAPLLILTSANAKNEMTKQQHRFLKIIGITPQQAYNKHNILPIEIFIEKRNTSLTKHTPSHKHKTVNHNQNFRLMWLWWSVLVQNTPPETHKPESPKPK